MCSCMPCYCLAILLGTKGDLRKFREKWAQGSGFCGGPKGSGRSEASGAEAPASEGSGTRPEGPLFRGALARPRLPGADLRRAFP